jgi:hypothetical protein
LLEAGSNAMGCRTKPYWVLLEHQDLISTRPNVIGSCGQQDPFCLFFFYFFKIKREWKSSLEVLARSKRYSTYKTLVSKV